MFFSLGLFKQGRGRSRGSVGVAFAITLSILATLIAGGLEVARFVSAKANLQGALDAAVLEAAKLPDGTSNSDRTAAAQRIFDINILNEQNIVSGSAGFTPDYSNSKAVTLNGHVTIYTIISGFPFLSQQNITASATAAKVDGFDTTNCTPLSGNTDVTPQNSLNSSSSNGCVWALNSGDVQGMLFNAGANISAQQCTFHDHATGSTSVVWNAGVVADIANLFTKGDILNNTTPNPVFLSKQTTTVLDDPYAIGLPQPTGTSCDYNGIALNGAATLNPGTYCYGANFNASGATIKLNPGLYIIRGGDMNFNSAIIDATGGVTIFFEDDSSFKFNGSTSINIEAPTSGTYANLAMYEKYGLSNQNRPFDAAAGMRLNGIIYFPSKDLIFNTNNQIKSMGIAIVADTVIFDVINWQLTPLSVTKTLQASTLSSLISDGSFESVVVPDGTRQKNIKLASWNSNDTIELGHGTSGLHSGGYGTDGLQYAKLHDNLYQKLSVTAGKTYKLSFDYQYSDNGNDTDSQFEVFINNVSFGVVQPSSAKDWQRIESDFYADTSDLTIEFRQVYGANTDDGPLLDRVTLVEDDGGTLPKSGCPGSVGYKAKSLRIVK